MINMTGWDLGTGDTSCCQVFVCLWQIWQQTRALKKVLKELNKLVFRLLLDWRAESKKTPVAWFEKKSSQWQELKQRAKQESIFLYWNIEGCLYIYILYKKSGDVRFLYHWESIFSIKHRSDVKALRKRTRQISLLVWGLSNVVL